MWVENKTIKIRNFDIVAILEPKISGVKADNFIKRSGFELSQRVEAEGFARGIWILWKEEFKMEFVFNHKQYIHFKVTDFFDGSLPFMLARTQI